MAQSKPKVQDNHQSVELTITKVSHIANPKNGNAFFSIEIDGKEQNITRSEGQFLTDLRESHLINASVKSVNDPLILPILQKMAGATVRGSVDFYEAGSLYLVDENSRAFKEGTAKVGDAIKRDKDGAHVDGFLTIAYSGATQLMVEAADKAGMYMSRLLGAVGAISAPAPQLDAAPEQEKTTV